MPRPGDYRCTAARTGSRCCRCCCRSPPCRSAWPQARYVGCSQRVALIMGWPLRETGDCRSPCPAEATLMLPTEDLFVYVYALIDDAIKAGAVPIPPRPGPSPACSDAELLAIAMVRHLLGRRSEAGFLAEVARDWGHL